jgi:hypothetical protein
MKYLVIDSIQSSARRRYLEYPDSITHNTFNVDSVSCDPPCCWRICSMETISVRIPALEIAQIPTTGPPCLEDAQPHAALVLSQCLECSIEHLNLRVGQGAARRQMRKKEIAADHCACVRSGEGEGASSWEERVKHFDDRVRQIRLVQQLDLYKVGREKVRPPRDRDTRRLSP